MAKTFGYMVTRTTYGTWLQGDKRGYVKNGKIFSENPYLKKANIQSMARSDVRLNKKQTWSLYLYYYHQSAMVLHLSIDMYFEVHFVSKNVPFVLAVFVLPWFVVVVTL